MSTRRALLFSFLDRYASLVLTIATSMVIARLLTPGDIGVYSVTMVFIMFIASMRDLGAGQYLVQETELTPQRIQSAWAVLLGVGLLLALVVLLIAHPVAVLYQDPRIFPIMCVVSLNFAINPFGSLTYAWLMREMRFDALALMRFGGSLAGALTSVWLAWKGHGPISLAYGSLASTLINSFISLRFRPKNFSWLPSFIEIKRVIGFGSKVSATGLLSNIASGLPEMVLGKLQNLAAAGLYSRANGLAMMFQKLVLDAAQAVALPLFARAQREQGCIDEPLMRAIAYVTALGWAFFVNLALLGFPIIRLLYGNQWDESVDLVRLLAVGMAIGLPAALCPLALMASGRSATLLKVSVCVVAVQGLLVSLGAWLGLNWTGMGFLAAQMIAMPTWLIICQRHLGFTWKALSKMLIVSAKLAGLTALAPLACVGIFGLRPESPFAPLLVSATLSTCAILFGARYFSHPIQTEIDRFFPQLYKSTNH
jgi:O-antigen/teichoic acid export membrane protein